MPLFEYRCQDCSRRFTMLVGVVAEQRELACPHCRSVHLKKLISRFGSPRSEDQMLDDLADPDRIGDIEEDPKRLKKWIREMGKTMDEDMGDDFEEMLESVDEPEAADQEGSSTGDAIY